MMKKTLLTVLIILGLSYSTQSMADVKNLPIICSLPFEEGYKPDANRKDYVLTGDDLITPAYKYTHSGESVNGIIIKKLIQNPKLILQHGFYNHEQKIKNLKLKCPSGSRMIKPYNKKYNKDKLKINPSYLSQMKKRDGNKDFNFVIKNGKHVLSDIYRENLSISFMLYVLSLEAHVIIDYKIIII